MPDTPPDQPAGALEVVPKFTPELKTELVRSIAEAPQKLREVVAELSDEQLDTPYRNWTVRQIVNHLSEGHAHLYLRFKWAITEENPTIKPFDHDDWTTLADSRHGDITPALTMLEGVHGKWVQLLESMTEPEFQRTFHHPETGENVILWNLLQYCVWHGRHHTAQIAWLRTNRGWDS